MASHDVVVVGAGQAGLAVARELTLLGIDPLVLERDRVGSAWSSLWDSFRLNTPAWSVQLPGLETPGDPDVFWSRAQIVEHLTNYRATIDADVREGVTVERLTPSDGRLSLETSEGPLDAREVVVCSGAYQIPHRPPGSTELPPTVAVLDAHTYRSPETTPEGTVLVVGAGQSGCQIAEDLVDAGREVILSIGRAPWSPRRIGDHDLVWWGLETGFLDQTIEDLPSPMARFVANVTASGVGGGHDLSPRTLRAKGVTIAGRLAGVDGGRIAFMDDIAESIAFGDARYGDLVEEVVALCDRRGITVPDLPAPATFDPAGPASIDVGALGAVVLTGGFRPAYGWIDAPGVVDEMGFPVSIDGASTVVPGLSFAGVHFLRRRRSSLLCGVGDDAAVVARGVARSLGRR